MNLHVQPATPDPLDQHRRAVRRNPRDANAHALLGLGLLRARQLEQGVVSLRRALELNQKVRGLQGVLAAALFELGRFEEAVAAYRAALRFENGIDLQQGLADALLRLGRAPEAEAPARRAAGLAPDNVSVLLSLGNTLHKLEHTEEAATVFARIVQLDPTLVDARYDLGLLLVILGRHADASACFRTVLEMQPTHAGALLQLGRSCRTQKLHKEAVACLTRLLELSPDNTEILVELGGAMRQSGDLAGAASQMRRALELTPDDTQAMYGLLGACFSMGEWELALQLARQALERAPSAAAHSVMLFILSHCCMDAEELTREHLAFAERWEAPLRALRQPHPNGRDPRRRLRVGIVSGDLYDHAVTNFIAPVFEAFKDSESVALYAYYNNTIEDVMSAQLRECAAGWRQIARMDDEAAERLIREDEIDILVDLAGHSALNRLTLFARKPAPIQCTWIGYAGTTGLEAMDYVLCDQFATPIDRFESQFSEKIVCLPLGAPFTSATHAPPVNPLPALSNGYITFGSFHRLNKLNRDVVRLWSRLLHAVPNAKMLLGGMQNGTDEVVTAWFAEQGIPRERLILRPRTHVYGFLEQHHEVDICLCPFPYSGSTTIGHALYMGVPTLATVGETSASHASVSLLAHLGLGDFIASNEEAYIALGVFLSQNFSALAAMRATMRDRFGKSLLGYPGIVAASVDHAWRMMWERWCAGESAAALRVRLSDLTFAA
ncbi:glycosyltransferase family 41 protein [Massilia sp. IC2-476]|uniref:O-linked N-acetylglucosamine transferase, SPINDLY family protein n=1 Tax=Massilia sp. IC2-476 TaxID=2887199 RepID=UPI001D10CDF0|nr:glycosyltransferase family 41 protein [Massilia sp. IC2-476]MCC2971778.1 tetratricopeptide repeat protein [Massilia sp. IC2-476]